MTSAFSHLKTDALAGLVVFLVALPLCLGIALASGAPLMSGVVAGVAGGLVVGFLSGSQVSVAGPAAGLTAIVLSAISTLGSFETFLAAVVLAGAFQLALGFARAGGISSYLPSNVIEGMLAAIGVIIIMKQAPLVWGHPGAMLIGGLSIAVLIAWNEVPSLKKLKAFPGALAAVALGLAVNEALRAAGSGLAIPEDQLVRLPTGSPAELFASLPRPAWSDLTRPDVWAVGATIAAVASIETLLCLEAADKMDPQKRFSDTNRELKAQGAAQIFSGFLGGLPVTSVIVRTTANINAGAKTKAATVFHGLFLTTAVLAVPQLLNRIPLACLAAVLIMTGWKLANPSVFMHMWKSGKYQFVPFAATVAAVVLLDLLKGVALGLAVSVLFILRANMKIAYSFKKEQHHEGETIHIDLAQEVSFLNKAAIKEAFNELPENCRVVINASNSFYIDHDVLELIRDFVRASREKGITVRLVGFKKDYALDETSLVKSY